MKSWLGRKVIALNAKGQVQGLLLGFKVNDKGINVLVAEGKKFHVVENIRRLSFQDLEREEVVVN